MQQDINKGLETNKGIESSKARLKDLHAFFVKCFDNDAGKKVLDHLDVISKQGFPDYNNVNLHYGKSGQQQLVDYIKGVIKFAKKEAK